MATSEKSLSASLLAGSDVIILYEWYCEPCSSENLHLEAAAFCQQCDEYLCQNCSKYHKKSTASKHHKLLEGTNMPQQTIVPKVRDVLTETCPRHTNNVLDYFCKKHSELCCSACANTSHKKCKGVSYVPDISNGTATSPEYKDLASQLDRLVATATNEQIRFELNDVNNDAYRDTAIDNINIFKKEMDTLMDKISKTAIQDVTRHHKENSDKIKSGTQKCQSVLSDAKTLATDLRDKAKAGKNNQLFVDLKLTPHRIPAIENKIQDVNCKTITHFTFDQENKVKEMTSALSAIWSLSTRQDVTHTKARYLREVAVKADKDEKDCWINGIAVLPGDRLVVTDYGNTAVKLVDTRSNKIISRIVTSSKPFDVTVVNQDEVAVALGNEQKIQIINISAKGLSESRMIKIPGDGFPGLCFDGHKFIILCDHARAVKTVDMSGTVSTVFTDRGSSPQFKNPVRIAIGRGKSTVYYITDMDANTVTCMTPGGLVISTYSHGDLKSPRGVTTGKHGALYVCSQDAHSVHQLIATGDHVKVVLDRQLGLKEWPHAIAYGVQGELLFISSNSTAPQLKNYIRLFQLE